MAARDDHLVHLRNYRRALDQRYPNLSPQKRASLVKEHWNKITFDVSRSQHLEPLSNTSVAQRRTASCMANFGADLHPSQTSSAPMTLLSAPNLARQASAPTGMTLASTSYQPGFPGHLSQSHYTSGPLSRPIFSDYQHANPDNQDLMRTLQPRVLNNVHEIHNFSPAAYLAYSTNSLHPMSNSAMTNSDFNTYRMSDMIEHTSLQYDQDGSASPVTSTSDSCLSNASTALSEPMSRSNTYDPAVYENLDMIRMSSTSTRSTLYDDCGMADPKYTVSCTPEGVFSQTFPYVSAFNNQQHSLSTIAMKSDDSKEAQILLSTDFLSSQSSSPRSATEHVGQHKPRTLAPKKAKDASKDTHIPRLVAFEEDGVIKHKAEITRAPRQPQPRKTTFCEFCNDKPQGFHGEHELRRHIERQHTQIRKVWVCRDVSEDGTFLRNCKSCRNNKAYGANYNAAAHLRRYHFNPCKNKRGGRNKKSEGRGGMGGGNLPSMDELKKWMYETYEVNQNGRSIVQDIALDASIERVPRADLMVYDPSFDPDTDPMIIDSNQYDESHFDDLFPHNVNQTSTSMRSYSVPQTSPYSASMLQMPIVAAYTDQPYNMHMSGM